MKPNTSTPFDWEKLARAANRAPRAESPEAPPGLATRILACVRERQRGDGLWLSWCLRAAAASLLLALVIPWVIEPLEKPDLTSAGGIESQIAELVFAP